MMTEKEYINEGGTKCPECDSIDISGGIVEVDAGGAWQDVSCAECGATWQDIYTLTSFDITN